MNRTFVVFVVALLAAVARSQTGHYKPYSVSPGFKEVANRKSFMSSFKLGPQAQALLRKNLFVVTPGKNPQLYDVYAENDYHDTPSLVTADNVLHIYHVFYDALLRATEQKTLLQKLERLNGKMLAEASRQSEGAKDAPMRIATMKNVAYFAVAERLLGHDLPDTIPAVMRPSIEVELKLIERHSGYEVSPIVGGKVDYSMFIVRGHYTKSEALGRYFKAMTWYSMPFALADDKGHPLPQGIRQAALAASAVQTGGGQADWTGIYEPTTMFVGSSNMYTPAELCRAALDTFGSSLNVDPSKCPAFLTRLQSFRKPLIVSARRKTGISADLQFRFMGRRFIPDSMILQELTGDPRPLPSGLDVMAVLGSRKAASILDADHKRYNPFNWSSYRPRRSELQNAFAKVGNDTWHSNLYWGWFDTLRSYVQPIPMGYPTFMRSPAWDDKRLSTTLGSWAELRHDTILYGEQSASEMGDGREPPFVPGFVEPSLSTYERLLALTKQTQSELTKRGLMAKEATDAMNGFQDTLKFLIQVVRRELQGQKLTKDTHTRIRFIEGELADATNTMLKYGTNIEVLTEDDLDMSLVADVHTAGKDALEEAIGRADDLIAVVPIEGKLYFARGSVYSHYEFLQPIGNRLGDTEWKKMVREGHTPARPHWTGSYFSWTAVPVKD